MSDEIPVTSDEIPIILDLDLKEGDSDSSGNVILHVFAKKPGKYAIYESKDHRVILKTDVSFADQPEINELLSNIADLTIHKPALKIIYNSLLAHSMKVYLDGDFGASRKLLNRIYQDMNLYMTRQSRIAYLLGAAILMVLSLCVFLVSRGIGVTGEIALHILWALVFSSMGGFLSIALRSQKLKIDPQNSYIATAVYGAIRIVIAMICGTLVYFLIRGEFLLGFLKGGADISGYIIAYFLSGFSEQLVPNIFNRIGRSVEQETTR